MDKNEMIFFLYFLLFFSIYIKKWIFLSYCFLGLFFTEQLLLLSCFKLFHATTKIQ